MPAIGIRNPSKDRVRVYGYMFTGSSGLKWSPLPSPPLQGIVAKGTFSRGGQQFQFPVVLSHRADDWRLLAAAYVLPPVAVLGVRHLLYRPLVRRHRLRKVRYPTSTFILCCCRI